MPIPNILEYDEFPPPYGPCLLMKFMAKNELVFIFIPKDAQYVIVENSIVYISSDGVSKDIRVGKLKIEHSAVYKRSDNDNNYTLYEQPKDKD